MILKTNSSFKLTCKGVFWSQNKPKRGETGPPLWAALL